MIRDLLADLRVRIRARVRPFRTLVRKQDVERESREEMAFHVDMQAAQYIAEGMGAAEARRRALRDFGGVERFREERRQASIVRVFEDLLADLGYAVRRLGQRPGFALAVALTLGLGIGGTTATFSVVDALFLRAPEGVAEPERLRRLYIERDEGNVQSGPGGAGGSWVDFVAMRGRLRPGEELAAFMAPRLVDMGRGMEAEQIRLGVVSHEFFPVLRVRPAAGRFFTAEEDGVEGAHPVVVLAHRFAVRRFGSAAGALGSEMEVNGQPLRVVGVAAPGFSGLHAQGAEAWVTSAMARAVRIGWEGWRDQTGMAGFVHYVARVAPGARPEEAGEGGTVALQHMAEAHPDLDPTPQVHSASLVPAAGPNRSSAADLSLWLVLVAAGVLLIACANVANLLLARAMTRKRETAVRLSLGASRGRVARQHLTESLVLAVLGAAAGILVAYFALGLVRQFPLPPSAGALDGRLLLFTAAVAAVTGVLFGVLPALRATDVDTAPMLRETRLGASRGGLRTRRLLVVLQVAVSLALLVGAGLFVRSLRHVHAIDAGVALDELLVVGVDLERAGFRAGEREAFLLQARERLAAMPGVAGTALVEITPFSGIAYSRSWTVPGLEDPGFTEGPYFNSAGPGYFEAAGIRLLEGRDFSAADARGAPVAIVNERMARGIAPDRSAIGTCIRMGRPEDTACTRVVGMVSNHRHRYLEADIVPMLYLPRAEGKGTLLVRAAEDPRESAAAVRAAVQSVRADLPYVTVSALEEDVRDEVLPFRLGATLFSIFGVLALALSAVGLYGVLAYFVTERTPEIAIRRSLGAPTRRVIGQVVRQGMAPVLFGAAIGLVAAWAGTRFLAALLFGVEPRDPVAFAAASTTLLVVALLATALPALRAARLDPMAALREE